MFFEATNALFTTFCFFGNKSKISFYNHNLQHVETSKVGQKVGSLIVSLVVEFDI